MIGRIAAVVSADIWVFYRSPWSYGLLALFMAALGYGAVSSPATWLETSVRGALVWVVFIQMFLCPALAVRLLARPVEDGSIELMLTSPVSDGELVIGKFLAGMAMLALFLGCSLTLPLLLVGFGNPEAAPVFTGYLMLVLLTAVFLSLGLLAAALARGQAVGFVLGVVVCVGVWVLGHGTASLASLPPATQFALSLPQQFDMMSQGVVDSRAVILPLSLSALALYCAGLVVEARRWV